MWRLLLDVLPLFLVIMGGISGFGFGTGSEIAFYLVLLTVVVTLCLVVITEPRLRNFRLILARIRGDETALDIRQISGPR